MTESRNVLWATIWAFLRKDLSFERLYERAREDDEFEGALGSELLVDLRALNSRDDPRLPRVEEAMWARAKDMLSVLECRCLALSSSTWIPATETEGWLQSLVLVRERGSDRHREAGRWPLAAYRCGRCGQAWLVVFDGDCVDGRACFSRLSDNEVAAITELDSWPERFDEISRILMARNASALAKLLREYPSVILEEGTLACWWHGITPLHTAVESSDIRLVRLVLGAGADLHVKTEESRTALHYAVRGDELGIASELLARGIDTEAADHEGLTALHLAASRGHLEMVMLLLAHGASRSASTRIGERPHDLASRNGHSSVAALLREGDSIE